MFIKRMLNLKNNTPNYMALGELVMMPFKIDIYTRMISYWGKINEPESHIMQPTAIINTAIQIHVINLFISNGYIA